MSDSTSTWPPAPPTWPPAPPTWPPAPPTWPPAPPTWSPVERAAGLLALCLMLSGAASLIYETIWLKEIQYIIGGSTHATTMILATFLGGLALGSAAVGRWGVPGNRPLRLYAFLEVLVAVAGFASQWFLIGGGDALPGALRSALLESAPGIHYVTLIMIILVPTVLMGATLPIACACVSRMSESVDKGTAIGVTFSHLYAANSIGAVGGIGLTGFWLIPRFGLTGSGLLAMILNILAGGIALLLDQAFTLPARTPSPRSKKKTRQKTSPVPEPTGSSQRQLLKFAFIAGMLAMGYEIVLIRLLSLVLGSSIHAFSILVGCFIGGIALGSTVAGMLIRRGWDPWLTMGWSHILAGVAFFLVLIGFDSVPVIYVWLRYNIPANFLLFQVILITGLSLVLTLPAAFIGMFLPLASESGSSQVLPAGNWIGRLYGANTGGNIVGTLLAGVVLVAYPGSIATLKINVLASVLLGILIMKRGQPISTIFLPVSIFACLLVCNLALPGIDMLLVTSGPNRVDRKRVIPFSRIHSGLTLGREIVFQREDHFGIVTVDRFAENGSLSLRVNGKVDANNAGDLPTQKLLAHVPMLAHPSPRRVLVIGLGSGITHASAACYPIDALRAIEISPAVVEASSLFEKDNHHILDDPRVQLIVEDARGVVTRDKATWDVIISQPSNPWMAGISNLYSSEFFQILESRLADQGVLCQWFHAYEVRPETVNLVLRTLRTVFRHIEVFRVNQADLIFLASRAPLAFDFDSAAQRMSLSPIREDLESVGIRNPFELAAHHLVAQEDLHLLFGEGPVTTDDRPILEYQAPIDQFLGAVAILPEDPFRLQSAHYLLRRWLTQEDAPDEVVIGLFRQPEFNLGLAFRAGMLEQYQKARPRSLAIQLEWIGYLARQKRFADALKHCRETESVGPDSPSLYLLMHAAAAELENRGLDSTAPGAVSPRLHALLRLVEIEPQNPHHALNALAPLHQHGLDEQLLRTIHEFRERFESSDRPLAARVLGYLNVYAGAALLTLARPREARSALEAARPCIDQVEKPVRDLFDQTWEGTREP